MSTYEALVQKNKDYIDLANNLYNVNLPYPTIKCNITGKCGGWAKPTLWVVNYNPHFLQNHTEHFLRVVVGHEIAHLVAHKLFEAKGHDSHWKRVMVSLGLTPKRTHDYNTFTLPKYVNSTYTYSCNCKDHSITTRIHESILSGRNRKCNTCNGRLFLKSAPVQMGKVTATVNVTDIIIINRNTNPLTTLYSQQVGKTLVPAEAATILLNKGKKITNKTRVAEIMVQYGMSKSDAELITIIQNTLNVTKSNASVYLYNYRKH